MSVYVAGHSFADTPNGRRCTSVTSDTGMLCNRAWLDVRGAVEADIGSSGIAHFGKLSTEEYKTIVAEREREIAAVWAAVNRSAGSK